MPAPLMLFAAWNGWMTATWIPSSPAARTRLRSRSKYAWSNEKMHVGEVNIDEALVTRLVVAQFPDLADLSIRAVPSMRTVNAIYRLGDHLCARLPCVSSWARDLHK